jgi:hypothetical protein
MGRHAYLIPSKRRRVPKYPTAELAVVDFINTLPLRLGTSGTPWIRRWGRGAIRMSIGGCVACSPTGGLFGACHGIATATGAVGVLLLGAGC